jgi:hypothetical protein
MEYLGLYNKPKAEVHPGHKLISPKEEEEGEEPLLFICTRCAVEYCESSLVYLHAYDTTETC